MMRFWRTVGIVVCAGVILIFLGDWLLSIIVHHRKEVLVPNIEGLSLQKSIEVLGDIKLYILKVGEKYDESIPSGYVISQRPGPGTRVRSGKVVKVILSTGSQLIYMPDITGKSLREVRIILHQDGLQIGEVTRVPSGEQEDIILGQEPLADQIITPGQMVNLVVSEEAAASGAQVMPNFLGEDIIRAQNRLKELGIERAKVEYVVSEAQYEGTILKQEPLPYESITRNENILFTVARKEGSGELLRTIPVHYEVSQGIEPKELRIGVQDATGEREVYRSKQMPGSKVDVSVDVAGPATIKIFSDGILVEQSKW